MRTSLSTLQGMFFFLCLFLLFFIIISFIGTFLMEKMSNQIAAIRIATILQDIFMFIAPAIVTAIIMTRVPAKFLFLDIPPLPGKLILGIVTLIVALPWLDIVVEWNESFTLPDSMSQLEESLRSAEKAAQDFVNTMLQGSSIGSLIISVCIIGVLAGLSEELFFRGAMLRLFLQTRMNHHLAVWTVAVIFSLMHFQFFGFIPRMLLGAYFGYLVWWTRSLWIPIIVHAVNNSIVVIAQWKESNSVTGGDAIEKSTAGDYSWVLVSLSIVFTILCLFALARDTWTQNNTESLSHDATV